MSPPELKLLKGAYFITPAGPRAVLTQDRGTINICWINELLIPITAILINNNCDQVFFTCI